MPRAASNQQAPNYNDIAEQLNAQCQRENRLGYGSYGEGMVNIYVKLLIPIPVYKVNLAGQPVALKYAYPTKHEAFTKEIRFLSSLPHSHYLVKLRFVVKCIIITKGEHGRCCRKVWFDVVIGIHESRKFAGPLEQEECP